MRFKRYAIVFIVLGLVGLLTTACGDDKKKSDSDATDTTEDGTDDMPNPDMDADTEDDADGGDDVDMGDDSDMAMMTLCDEYCETVMTNCTGANAQYTDLNECLTTCEGLPEGMDGDTNADSVYCRLYHAGDPSALDPAFHCPHAGADGGGVCVDEPATGCARFCANVTENCAGDYAVYTDADECLTECANFPDTGSFGDDSGDTIQCRDRYAQVAVEDPVLCLAASSSGGGVCVDDPGTAGQIDRMGRPAINTALISSSHKDLYNFASPAEASFFVEEMTGFLQAIDALDGDDTNGVGPMLFTDHATLAGALAADFLLLDISEDDCFGGYLAIETDQGNNCGGRTLEQDVMDVTLQILVDVTADTIVTDAVDSNDNAFSTDFPYLAAPN